MKLEKWIGAEVVKNLQPWMLAEQRSAYNALGEFGEAPAPEIDRVVGEKESF